MPYVVVPNKAEIPVVFNNATNEFISLMKGSDLGVGIEVEETINTECDDIEETTADRNEVQIRQLNQTETEEPCDVPKETARIQHMGRGNQTSARQITMERTRSLPIIRIRCIFCSFIKMCFSPRFYTVIKLQKMHSILK
jgi:hypothetical protein